MGVVSDAIQESLGRHVAIKVFSPWAEADTRGLRFCVAIDGQGRKVVAGSAFFKAMILDATPLPIG